MGETFVAKVTTVGNAVGIIIPKKVLKEMNIKKGDYIKIEIKEVLKGYNKTNINYYEILNK